MEENLFGTAAGLLEGAGQKQTQNMEAAGQADKTGAENARDASKDLSAQRRQDSAAVDAQKLAILNKQLDSAENMMTITPQIALGLTKNTGDKEWLKAVGQKMRSDVVMSFYTHGMKLEEQKKGPKITQIYDKSGKVRHSVVYTDEDGNVQQLLLDEGITPENLNKGKGSGGKKGSSGSDDSLKKMKEFNRAYEKARSEISDPAKAAQLKATNPDSYNEKSQWLKDNQDQYDANIKSLGKGGGAAIPGADAGGSSATPDNAPFDADAFIKDALGSANK